MPIPISRVAIISPEDGKPTGVGYGITPDGEKVRVCRRTGRTSRECHGGHKQLYRDELRDRLRESLGLDNVMQVPRLEKIVLNMGVGEASRQARLLEGAIADMITIAGQRPVTTRAKRSIAGFRLREGNAVGVKVTLRGDRMWEFFDRLINLAIPRIRDFRGLSLNSFDGNGNYSFGVSEQLIFPEIDYDKIDTIRGMDITLVTTAPDDESARALLEAFGFPLRRDQG
ncbi:MAG: 50S ribosomal protein L5 [Acidimicrobiia bacterium]|nr:50S ribosomal protein L5 [Acidimicrobiia bacterium]